MKWYFLLAGVAGMPFTGGLSIILGLLMFLFIPMNNAQYERDIEKITQSPTPIHAASNGCISVLVGLAIGVVFLVAMLAVGMAMMGGG